MDSLKSELDQRGLGTVLCVDDDTMSLKLMTKVLRKIFTGISSASDGTKAIETFHKIKPQFILTDISMPGMDGITMVKEIKKIDEDIEIIFVTGHDDSSYHKIFKELNAYALTKPLDRRKLINTLKSIIKDKENE